MVTIYEAGKANEQVLEQARTYLERYGVDAHYSMRNGPVVSGIKGEVGKVGADLLIVGSYEYSSFLEPVLGGVLDELLRQCRIPVLIGQ